MPKTRKKINSIGFTKSITSLFNASDKYLLKSGILSVNESKIFKEEELSFSYFPDELIHSNQAKSNYDTFFHDKRTIVFDKKFVSPTMRLETKYISPNSLTHVSFYNENKILKTPCIPNYHYTRPDVIGNNNLISISHIIDGSFVSNADNKVVNTSDVYDRMLKEKHLKTETSAFSEKTNWTDDLTRSSANKYSNKKIISKEENYNTITIDYDLHKSPRPDLYLSFSKLQNTSQVTFPDDTSYYTFNGNTAYFYNNEYTNSNFGPYDYLGNIAQNYKSSINSFLNESPICFSSISPYTAMSQVLLFPQLADSIKKTQWAGIPIDTFGFPYNNKFDAAPRHLIPASSYISKPFVIEKVCLEFNMSNWSVVKGTGGPTATVPCLNFVNFFILNQRGKINTNNLENTKTVKYYDNGNSFINVNNTYSGRTTYTTNNKSSSETYTDQEIEGINNGIAILGFEDYLSSSINTLLRSDKIEEVDSHVEKNTKNQQKDLITTVSIANYAYQADPDNNPLVNQEKIIDLVDLFVNESNNPLLGPGSVSECIYKDKKFKITSPVKHFFKNQKLPRLSNFHIYPEKIDSGRTNLNISSKRSLSGENLNNTGTKSFFSEGYNDIQINEFDFKESKYILNPEDNLVLGVTLSNGFVKSNDVVEAGLNIIDGDLVKISCSEDYPLKLHLIGYYLEDENKKVIVNKTTKQFKNTKRIGYYQNEVVDQIGSNLGYLEQNFYDYWFKDATSRVPLGGTERDFTLSSFYRQSEFTYSNLNKTRLGNFAEIPNLSIGRYNFNAGMTFLLPGAVVPQIFNDELLMNTDLFNSEIYKEKETNNFKLYRHYYNKYRFGMFADRLNYNKIYQFANSKYQNIRKKFMKGFYKQKTAATVKGKISFDFTGIHEYTGRNFLFEKIFDSSVNHTWEYPTNSSTLITVELAVLEVNFTDENDKKIKFIFQIPIFDGTVGEKTIYASGFGGLGVPSKEYIDGVFVYKKTLSENIAENFINLNYDTSINVAKYLNSGRILTLVSDSLFTTIISEFAAGFNFAGINITPSISQNSQKEFFDIDFEINNKGKLNNASLQAGRSGSNVSYENFALEEGDLLNSYNTTSNALHSDSDIIFKDR